MKTKLTLLAALALALGACDDDDSTSGADASPSTDAGPIADSGPDADQPDADRPDASADSGPDAAQPDAGPSELEGTSLAGVTLGWAEPLALCNRWYEGNDRATELGRKVQVILEPREALPIDRAGLAALQAVTVAEGPMADSRQRAVSAGQVERFTVTQPEGDSQLDAAVRWTVGERPLTLNLTVSRTRTTPTPVDPTDYEAQFVLGEGDDVEELVPCDGGRLTNEDAATVIVATSGDHNVTVLRRFRTTHNEFSAGSFPVFLQSHLIIDSERPYELVEVQDFFAQTYVASHHNWDEATLLDLTRDRANHYLYFQPDAAPVDPALALVEYQAVDGVMGERARLTLERRPQTGEPTRTTLDVQGHSARIDEAALARQNEGRCAVAPKVFALGGFDQRLAFVTCPDASAAGFTLLQVIPVVFPDVSLVGQPLPEEAITPATFDDRPGYRIEAGAYEVELSRFDSELLWLTIKDPSGETLNEQLASPQPVVPAPAAPLVLRQASADGAVKLVLTRRWAAQGVGESSIYAPLSLMLTLNGEPFLVDAWDRLSYTNSHHNWADRLTAQADGVTFDWSLEWDMENGGILTHFKATKADGQVLFEGDLVTESER